MLNQRILFPLLVVAATLTGCKKDVSAPDCQKLKDGMSSDNSEIVITEISQLVDELSSKIYNEQNLNELCASISRQCDFTAEVYCFDCIDTLPAQSEISISFGFMEDKVEKTIDISYTSDNIMKVVAMHD